MCCGQTKQEIRYNSLTWWRAVHTGNKVMHFSTREAAEEFLAKGFDGVLPVNLLPIFNALKTQWEKARA